MTNRKRQNLILDVENFGPIAKAKGVEIKPMTVFVGPNNAGKSYMAIMLHAILQGRDTSTYELQPNRALDSIRQFFGVKLDELRTKTTSNCCKTTIELEYCDILWKFVLTDNHSYHNKEALLQSPRNSYYLPSSREGVIAMFRYIDLRSLSLHSNTKLNKDRISFDFLTKYKSALDEYSSYDISNRIADLMEKSILNGRIKKYKDEFMYCKEDLAVHAVSASSMVSEITPIVLFLRSYMEQDDLLIIEEPEAHLHPEAQQKMAAALAFMVRNGLRVLITTHSHYMVEQMSTFVNASHADPEERASKLRLLGADVDKDVYLNEDEIAVYDFAPQAVDGGTVVREVPLDNDEYIFAPENHSKAISDQFNRNSRMLSTRINKE